VVRENGVPDGDAGRRREQGRGRGHVATASAAA
jgi:hypothetical protein